MPGPKAEGLRNVDRPPHSPECPPRPVRHPRTAGLLSEDPRRIESSSLQKSY
jgi:hypothetical protein